jgi:hypothetical protein
MLEKEKGVHEEEVITVHGFGKLGLGGVGTTKLDEKRGELHSRRSISPT